MFPDVITRQQDLLSPNQAAARLHLSGSSLAKMRCLGGGPAYLKFGRSVRYEQKALDDWLGTRRVRNTSDAARLPQRLTTAPPLDGQPPAQQKTHAEPEPTASSRPHASKGRAL